MQPCTSSSKPGSQGTASEHPRHALALQALAAEVTANFGKRLEALGLSVRELTGDMQLSKKEMAETQVSSAVGLLVPPALLQHASHVLLCTPSAAFSSVPSPACR